MSETEPNKCELCGEPMPAGEEMFKYHGYSGDCPKPPLPHATFADAPPVRTAPAEALPDIEIVSAKVHEAWMQSKVTQGVTSRRSESGEELMVPYHQLSDTAKDLDRGTVEAVYAAIQHCAADASPLVRTERAEATEARLKQIIELSRKHDTHACSMIRELAERALSDVASLVGARAPQANMKLEDVPAWLQIQAGNELTRLVEIVRFAPGQPTGFLHSNFDAAGLLWRWALKWFAVPTPPDHAPRVERTKQEQDQDLARGHRTEMREGQDLPHRNVGEK